MEKRKYKRLTNKEKLDKLKDHIKSLNEINKLKEEYNLNQNITKVNPYITISGRIRQEELKGALKICKKRKITLSKLIRKLLLKEIKESLK